jgi:hypothetical protein
VHIIIYINEFGVLKKIPVGYGVLEENRLDTTGVVRAELLCGCCNNIIDRIAGDLAMSNVCKHIKASCLLFVHLSWNKCFLDDITHREILRMRVYRIPSRDFLVIGGLYVLQDTALLANPIIFRCVTCYFYQLLT